MKNKKTILVVEDEASLRKAIREKFVTLGYNVLEAKDGREGVVTALSQHPDLILLDVIMPVMDGLSALKEIRQDPWGKTAKIIILTNLSDNEDVTRAMSQGTHDYLVKSNWKIDDIAKIVKKKIG
ncbi:MAG: response regulator [Candidatus Buchananbacteria bacterium]